MGNVVTFYSLVAPSLLTTIMAGILNLSVLSGRSQYKDQDPAVSQEAGGPSSSRDASQGSRPQPAQPVQPRKPQKSRKWTGNLVDAVCMSNSLDRLSSLNEALLPDPLSDFWQTLQSAERAGQKRNSGVWSPQGQPQTPSEAASARDADGEPDASERQIAVQQAQLKRVNNLEQAVKACTPTGSTVHYGLVVSGGKLLKFDSAGDSKARHAVNTSPIERGKALRVKVTGVIEPEGNLRDASIEIRDRIPAPQVSSGR